MGTLMGHVLPGSFFIGFAFWWTWAIFQRYYLCQKGRGSKQARPYRNSASYQCSCYSKLPLEGILKLTAITIGILGETITGFENGQFVHYGNAQHITMFFFFGLNGLMDILYFYTDILPPGLDYMTASMAYGIEALLFANHLHGRTTMDKQVHYFLNYAVIACAVSTLCELKFRKNIVASLFRVLFTMVQGFWFCTVGFILYPPSGWMVWDQENHDQMMNVTTLYCWHYVFALLCMAGIGTAAAICAKRCSNKDDNVLLVEYGRVGEVSSESDDEDDMKKRPRS